MPRGKFSWKREDGAIITHCGGTEVKNTHSGDYFFTKGEFCGVCKKSKKANRQNILTCPGCKLAKYCSKACQHRDLESHKKDCDNVAHYLEMLPKIEAKFLKWNWNEHQDVQAKYGDWRDVVFACIVASMAIKEINSTMGNDLTTKLQIKMEGGIIPSPRRELFLPKFNKSENMILTK